MAFDTIIIRQSNENDKEDTPKIGWVGLDDGSLKMLQSVVDGYIEKVPIDNEFYKNGIDVWVNEDGRFREDLKPTLVITHKGRVLNYLVGNVVFTGFGSEGETLPLDKEQREFIHSRLAMGIANIGDKAHIVVSIEV